MRGWPRFLSPRPVSIHPLLAGCYAVVSHRVRTGNTSVAAKNGADTKRPQVPNFAVFVYERARGAKGTWQQVFLSFCVYGLSWC